MTNDGGDLSVWFNAFAAQSISPRRLSGAGRVSRRLGGGKSGASAALFLCDDGPIVLKWDALSKVLVEATVRRERAIAADSASSEAKRFRGLQERGASHIAVQPNPDHEQRARRLFGIIAYQYVGPDPKRPNVTDLEAYIRGFVAGRGQAIETQLSTVFRQTLERFFVPLGPTNDGYVHAGEPTVDGKPLRLSSTIVLADGMGFNEALADALDYVAAQPLRAITKQLRGDLLATESWWNGLIMAHRELEFGDSRLVHGDPRFANIMVDLDAARDVELIDYGAGGPGGHVFKDLARLEIDVLLRTTPMESRARIEEVRERMEVLLNDARAADLDAQHLKCAAIWRDARDRSLTNLRYAQPEYRLFLMRELVRRVNWYRGPEPDVGGSVPEILAAIDVLMKAPMDG